MAAGCVGAWSSSRLTGWAQGETDDVRVSPRGYSCVAPQDVAHDLEA